MSAKPKDRPLFVLISALTTTRNLAEAITNVKNNYGNLFDFQAFFLNELTNSVSIQADLFQKFEKCSILMFDIRGNDPIVAQIVENITNLKISKPNHFKQMQIISLVGGNSELRSLTKLGNFHANKIPSNSGITLTMDDIPELTAVVKKGIKMGENIAKLSKFIPFKIFKHMKNWNSCMEYWTHGHGGVPENLEYLFELLLRDYLHIKNISKPPDPQKIPLQGIYDPMSNQYYPTLQEYLDVKQFPIDRQFIGLFFYGGIYFEQSIPVIQAFMEQLSHFNIIPVYSETLENLQTLKKYFLKDNRPLISAVINFQYFQVNGGPFGGNNTLTLDFYKHLNVPQFNPIINFDRTKEEYLQNSEGMSPINQIIAIIMPELDGRIEMMNVGYMGNYGKDTVSKLDVLEIVPDEETVRFYCNRITKWMRLRKRTNQEKKIAIILYNYPPGEENLGNASYLDVFSSLEHILRRLDAEGYSLGKLKPYLDALDQTEGGLDSLFLENFLLNDPKYLNTPKKPTIQLNNTQYQELFDQIPRSMQNEVLQQWGQPLGDIMVSKNNLDLPLIQFGNVTLGIQPARNISSKEMGDYHNQALPPHHQYIAFYQFLEKIADVDAIVHLGTHGTIEFLPGKESSGYCHDWNLFLLGSTPNLYAYHINNTSESAIAKRRGNAVIINHASPPMEISGLNEKCALLQNLLNYLPENDTLTDEIQDISKEIGILATSRHTIEASLYRMNAASIPRGLHILGKNFDEDFKAHIILNLLLHGGNTPNFLQPLRKRVNSNNLDRYMIYFKEIISYSMVHEINAPLIPSNLDLPKKLTDGEIKQLELWIKEILSKISNSRELENLLWALDGGFVEPGVGGDYIRNVDVFPTGRNSFGFDPRLIPSTTATLRGNEIAETILDDYQRLNGQYPETTSVVLWAFEVMKTGGETIGQIFNYLGVKAIKTKSVWTTELEVVPLSEMTHPRINVVVTICGIFRDTFPNLVQLIDHAVELVSNLDETDAQNFIKKSTDQLKANNLDCPTARIFGPARGKYNTNLTQMINSNNWEGESELAQDYLNSMAYRYTKSEMGAPCKDSFIQNIASIEIMSQIRDGADYDITDLDHYYEFTGGLSKTYEQISGKECPIVIADTSSHNIHVGSLKERIQEGVLTRNLNPKWIEGLLHHKYHGTQKVAEKVENLLGFSSTTHEVDNWIWEQSYEKYIEDETLKNRLIENNRFAMMKMINTFLEANNRGYWETDEEKINNLKKLFIDLEGWVEMEYSN